VREQSATRRELESKIRALLPLRVGGTKASNPVVASAGVGGLLSGFVWGWLRGRRKRSGRSS
jgi:fructose-specific phosphotransferase system IIC component